ncbi:MAG: DinB family protein [Pirellulaceae bacterium]
MNAKEALKINLDMGEYISLGYLGDLTEQDLMHRPAQNANHIRWQLGHLIVSEHEMIEGCFPGSMPKLPEGFKAKYAKETAASDKISDFHTKDQLMEAYKQQRAATLKNLEKVSEADLSKASPESMQSYAPTVGAALSMQGTHWVMHAGQWAVIRRQLGRAPLF